MAVSRRLAVIAASLVVPCTVSPTSAQAAERLVINPCAGGIVAIGQTIATFIVGRLEDEYGGGTCVGSVSAVFTPDDVRMRTPMVCAPPSPYDVAGCLGWGSYIGAWAGLPASAGGTISWTAIVNDTQRTGSCHVTNHGHCII